MTDTHNNKQKAQINKAWDYLSYWAARTQRLDDMLNKAMKRDAKLRSSKQSSKALIMALGMHIYVNDPAVKELEREEPDIIIGGLSAYRCIKSAENYGSNEELAKLVSLCIDAVELHKQCVRARLMEH